MSGYGAYIYEGVLRGRSPKAILVEIDGDEHWLPVSMVGAHEDAEIGQALPAPLAGSRYTVQRGRYGNVRVHEDGLPVAWIARRDKTEQGETAALRMAGICAEALNNLQLPEV